MTRNNKTKPGDAASMWRAYKRNPDGVVKAVTNGRINPVTGEEQESHGDEEVDLDKDEDEE